MFQLISCFSENKTLYQKIQNNCLMSSLVVELKTLGEVLQFELLLEDIGPEHFGSSCAQITLPKNLNILPAGNVVDDGPSTFVIHANDNVSNSLVSADVPHTGDILTHISSTSDSFNVFGNHTHFPAITDQNAPLPTLVLPYLHINVEKPDMGYPVGLCYNFTNLDPVDKVTVSHAEFVAVVGTGVTTITTAGFRVWFLEHHLGDCTDVDRSSSDDDRK